MRVTSAATFQRLGHLYISSARTILASTPAPDHQTDRCTAQHRVRPRNDRVAALDQQPPSGRGMRTAKASIVLHPRYAASLFTKRIANYRLQQPQQLRIGCRCLRRENCHTSARRRRRELERRRHLFQRR